MLVPLDIETTSNMYGLDKGAVPIGVASYLGPGQYKTIDIRCSGAYIQPSAMRVNKIETLELDSEDRIPLTVADKLMASWLWDNLSDPANVHEHIMCGFNVGRFDRAFMDKFMPKTLKRVHAYRSYELNTILAAWVGSNAPKLMWNRFKTLVKQEAMGHLEDEILIGYEEHHQLFDSALAYHMVKLHESSMGSRMGAMNRLLLIAGSDKELESMEDVRQTFIDLRAEETSEADVVPEKV